MEKIHTIIPQPEHDEAYHAYGFPEVPKKDFLQSIAAVTDALIRIPRKRGSASHEAERFLPDGSKMSVSLANCNGKPSYNTLVENGNPNDKLSITIEPRGKRPYMHVSVVVPEAKLEHYEESMDGESIIRILYESMDHSYKVSGRSVQEKNKDALIRNAQYQTYKIIALAEQVLAWQV